MNPIEQQLQTTVRLHATGDIHKAEELYRQILASHPRYAAAWEHLGRAHFDQEKYNDAITCFQQVLALDPRHASALNNLGNTYRRLGRQTESLDCYDRALAIQPTFAAVHTNKASVLIIDGQIEAALHHFEQALSHDPSDPHLHKSIGIARLMLGDFARGWPEYEWRYQACEPALPQINHPLWDGSALDNKTILLICEPGLGDDIQFIRYAPWLKNRYGCRILLAGRPALRALLSSCDGIDLWIDDPPPEQLPPFDCFAPLMRIPAVLGHTFSDFPVVAPYLTSDPQLTQHWNQRLASYPGRKIGIHWRVGHHQGIGAHRSIPLAEFAKLTQLPNTQLFSLQKGPATAELVNYPQIIDLGSALDETTGAFIETAAVLKNLDLLITCDTAIGHVAGALGTPVWLALCKPCDWRWHQSGPTTLWYSSMRLFRQPTPGNWPALFEQIGSALS